jgi:peptidoglycan hydrolase-like protein with peptidoglycan-binding domain
MLRPPHRFAAVLAGAALVSLPVGTAAATEPRSVDPPRVGVVAQADETENDETGETENDGGATPLAVGDRDQLVGWWQDRLNDWLLLSGSNTYPIVVDGWFGPQTEQATIEFQESVEDSKPTASSTPPTASPCVTPSKNSKPPRAHRRWRSVIAISWWDGGRTV